MIVTIAALTYTFLTYYIFSKNRDLCSLLLCYLVAPVTTSGSYEDDKPLDFWTFGCHTQTE